MSILFGLLSMVVLSLFVWRWYVQPSFLMRPISLEQANEDEHCIVDIRDFISYYRKPMPIAKNIPLSYLSREMREGSICSKEIVIVADNIHAARSAARVVNRQAKQKVKYSLLPPQASV
ncbi:rhodanese-like domain-containing protein [Bacillaceae bacterium SIJ1]|uniref:rhodanese-like domain-containing protein n=1 Tax=Litoribacterium kuwaitense TaxID=1398745 RepID=UPI0013EA46B9|nr:rhodanese-like domain-containing protein [Litoribacterium kuwaitense]NGP44220.1 rhodanese-like domain-containing protein [Litoribacterium kuwaitense]